MDNGFHSDLVICVGEQQFEAHKNVLSSQSKVFESLIKSNSLTIDDVEPQVFSQILDYLYTNSVKKLDQMAAKLLVASDNYKLDQLKAKCEVYLSSDINTENWSNLLILSHRHSATILKTAVMDFLRSRSTQVSETEKWKKLQLDEPKMMQEITEVFPMQLSAGCSFVSLVRQVTY